MKARKSEEIKIILYRPEGGGRIYSNYVHVATTPIDVSLRFADVKPPASLDEEKQRKKDGYVKVPALAEIVLDKEIAKSLLKILNKQLSGRKNKDE